MRNIKLTVEYDGTHFAGWQIQSANERTVQGELEKALLKIFQKPIRIHGSGRTDAGVHALGQVANFKVDSTIAIERLPLALNAHLPTDIAVISAEEVKSPFNAQFSAKEKTYRYTILHRKTRGALDQHKVYHYPHSLKIARMRQAAKSFLGRHDFKSFAATDAKNIRDGRKGTVRTIKNLTIKKSQDRIIMDITADGFLYKMVRNIVGVLIEVGNEKRALTDIPKIFKAQSRLAAGQTAPAQGLTLLSVKY